MKHLISIAMILFSIGFALANGVKDPPYSTVTAAGVTLNYLVTADMQNLDCQLIASTTGWIAVGFAPSTGMQSANFIIGYHSGGSFIRDDWGTSPSSHASDTSLGGTDNIISVSSSEEAGVTQLNFIIPLNSGDNFDRALVIGQTYDVLLARGFGGADNYTSGHAARGSAQITIPQPVSVHDDYVVTSLSGISSYPNPFSSQTNITFQLKSDSQLNIAIYNSKGQKVKTIPQTYYKQGENNFIWNGRNDKDKALPDGIYFLQIESERQSQSYKIFLLR